MGLREILFIIIFTFILTCLFCLLIFLFEQLFPKFLDLTDKFKNYLKGGVL